MRHAPGTLYHGAVYGSVVVAEALIASLGRNGVERLHSRQDVVVDMAAMNGSEKRGEGEEENWRA